MSSLLKDLLFLCLNQLKGTELGMVILINVTSSQNCHCVETIKANKHTSSDLHYLSLLRQALIYPRIAFFH